MLRKIIHINKPYVGDMSWLLIDYTDISITLRQEKPIYISGSKLLFNILTTSEITPKSESLFKENLKLYKQHHPKV